MKNPKQVERLSHVTEQARKCAMVVTMLLSKLLLLLRIRLVAAPLLLVAARPRVPFEDPILFYKQRS